MALNIERELSRMREMTVDALRGLYAETFRESTNCRNKQWLIKRIAWRMQANEEGDLSERARRRAMEIANDADLRTTAPKVLATKPQPTPAKVKVSSPRPKTLPITGTMITREYKGKLIEVTVLPNGFEWQGESYASLRAVAKAVTGQHCSGNLFFRQNGRGGAK